MNPNPIDQANADAAAAGNASSPNDIFTDIAALRVAFEGGQWGEAMRSAGRTLEDCGDAYDVFFGAKRAAGPDQQKAIATKLQQAKGDIAAIASRCNTLEAAGPHAAAAGPVGFDPTKFAALLKMILTLLGLFAKTPTPEPV